MSISATNLTTQKQHIKKTIFYHLLAASSLLLFSVIYHQYGHGQFALIMYLSFIYPLLVAIAYWIIVLFKLTVSLQSKGYRLGYNSLNSGIATLSIACVIKGIFIIAGTNSSYLILFWIMGIFLSAFGASVVILYLIPTKQPARKSHYSQQ